MGRKRVGVGKIAGNKKKSHKVPRKKKPPTENEDSEPEKDYFAIKISARTAIRSDFHRTVIPWITAKSIEATKICELASLLFLNVVQNRFEGGDWNFFVNSDGCHIIENCFHGVIKKYVNSEDMLPEFRDAMQQVSGEHRIDWPHNTHFGNLSKYLYQQYARNVKTNLTTHAYKRVFEFLKLLVFRPNICMFTDEDAKNAAKWAIYRFDATRGDQDKLRRRNELLEMMQGNVVTPPDFNVAQFTRDHWFLSLTTWLEIQRQIDEYHDWAEASNNTKLPKIKNLAVIPICSHLRKPIRIDADVLSHMLAETRLIPRDKYNRQIDRNDIIRDKENYFNQYFNMEHIHRILKANKEFQYSIVCDGVSASILYKVPKNVLEQLESDDIIKKRYEDGHYHYELGIDPGMRTWNATVRRHIASGKEVSIV